MHELAITENIIKISSEEAKKYNAKKVKSINIKMGTLSDLIPECIQSYFDIASEGTIVEGATLIIDKIPINMVCNNCGKKSNIYTATFKCSYCGSNKIKLIGGHEFYIDSMEVV